MEEDDCGKWLIDGEVLEHWRKQLGEEEEAEGGFDENLKKEEVGVDWELEVGEELMRGCSGEMVGKEEVRVY